MFTYLLTERERRGYDRISYVPPIQDKQKPTIVLLTPQCYLCHSRQKCRNAQQNKEYVLPASVKIKSAGTRDKTNKQTKIPALIFYVKTVNNWFLTRRQTSRRNMLYHNHYCFIKWNKAVMVWSGQRTRHRQRSQ